MNRNSLKIALTMKKESDHMTKKHIYDLICKIANEQKELLAEQQDIINRRKSIANNLSFHINVKIPQVYSLKYIEEMNKKIVKLQEQLDILFVMRNAPVGSFFKFESKLFYIM